MSTPISILPEADVKDFESPPRVSNSDRDAVFALTAEAQPYFKALRTPVSKLSFVLQYGYFRARYRFYEPDRFHTRDIQYVVRHFHLTSLKAVATGDTLRDLRAQLGGATATRHRQEILRLERFVLPDDNALRLLEGQAQAQSQRQTGKVQVFDAVLEYCIKQRWVIPSYSTLCGIVGRCYQSVEDRLVDIVALHVQPQQKQDLLALLAPGGKRASLLTEAKTTDQSIRTQSMQSNAKQLQQFREFFFANKTAIDQLALTDQALAYYAQWIVKAKTHQVKQFRDSNKTCLYLLAFVKFQYFQRQDYAMIGVLAAIRTAHNKAKKLATQTILDERGKHLPALGAVVESQQRLTVFANEILQIVEDETLSASQKNELIRNRVLVALDREDKQVRGKVDLATHYLAQESDNHYYYDRLAEEATRLTRKVSSTIKALVFDQEEGDKLLIQAVVAYQQGRELPTAFLSAKEKALVLQLNDGSQALLKMLLLIHLMRGVKGGKLNLLYGFEFRSLQSYMLDKEQWEGDKPAILETAGLARYRDSVAELDAMKTRLHDGYITVNAGLSSGHNPYLQSRPDGRYSVKTPAIGAPTHKFIAQQLMTKGSISILQILREIEHHYPFLDQLSHHTQRNAALSANPQTAFAGLMALGCNIGPHKMGRLSLGISANELIDMVNWRFSPANLRRANRVLTDAIDEVALSNVYKVEDNRLHSSSDGKKVTVATDSLHANYSYKYFGKESGVAVYSFVDEKQSLFHSIVFSSTHREAAFVLDGLLHNSTTHNRMHSTDTHGYTEALFAVSHFLGIAFAPRIKRIETQALYDFHRKAYYEEKGCRLVPRNPVKQAIVEEHWDEMLRFMATIKLGHSSASQLFARLNSYSSDHPLYQALKAFGRIVKSQYLVTYYDDLRLRQRVQKQLNVVELSNKFHDAVFWDRKSEFHVGTREEQEKYTLCRSVLQNAIILWNYLTLSTQLLEVKRDNSEAYDEMVEEIGRGSVLTWRHVDFQGKYDFRKPPRITNTFPLKRIQTLTIAPQRE